MTVPVFRFLLPPAEKVREAIARFDPIPDGSTRYHENSEHVWNDLRDFAFDINWRWWIIRNSVYENGRRTTTFKLNAHMTIPFRYDHNTFRLAATRHSCYVPNTGFMFVVEMDREVNPVLPACRTATSND